MEIRVVDKNNSSTVFASSYVQGKTAMIPAVFLDPNYNTRELKINNNIYIVLFSNKNSSKSRCTTLWNAELVFVIIFNVFVYLIRHSIIHYILLSNTQYSE